MHVVTALKADNNTDATRSEAQRLEVRRAGRIQLSYHSLRFSTLPLLHSKVRLVIGGEHMNGGLCDNLIFML